MDTPSPQFLAHLRQGITRLFDTNELKIMCTDLDVDYENLGGDGKEAKILELILYMKRRARLKELQLYCAAKRPAYDWPKVKVDGVVVSMPRLPGNSIFISYRRSDSQLFTDRIYERLAAHFGSKAVFRDIHSIKYGERFPVKLQQALSSCHVMIVVIGPTWSTVVGKDGRRRLVDPQDWVRLELEEAIKRHIPIIPLLLENNLLPSEDNLPGMLKQLRQYHCAQIRLDLDFRSDMKRLIQNLEVLTENLSC